jgi:hypothetical protein
LGIKLLPEKKKRLTSGSVYSALLKILSIERGPGFKA